MSNLNSRLATNLLTAASAIAIAGVGIGLLGKNAEAQDRMNSILDAQEAAHRAQVQSYLRAPVYAVETPHGFTASKWCLDENFEGSLEACVDTFKTLNRNTLPSPGDTIYLTDNDGNKYILGVPVKESQRILAPKYHSTDN